MLTALALLGAGMAVGCHTTEGMEQDAEEAGDAIKETAEEAVDAVEEAAEETEDAID